jgi:hypothetical protein
MANEIIINPIDEIPERNPLLSDRMETSGWSLVPKSFSELQDFCSILAKSAFIPKAYQGKPADILAVIQFGSTLKLNPFQSLQGISNINGMPQVWGKTKRALVFRSKDFGGIDEGLITEGPEDARGARCTLMHKTRGNLTVTFTMADAKKAGLAGKAVWQQYPLVMCGHRAFSRCADALFPDVTMGFAQVEDDEDFSLDPKDVSKDVTPVKYVDGVERILIDIEEDDWEESDSE